MSTIIENKLNEESLTIVILGLVLDDKSFLLLLSASENLPNIQRISVS